MSILSQWLDSIKRCEWMNVKPQSAGDSYDGVKAVSQGNAQIQVRIKGTLQGCVVALVTSGVWSVFSDLRGVPWRDRQCTDDYCCHWSAVFFQLSMLICNWFTFCCYAIKSLINLNVRLSRLVCLYKAIKWNFTHCKLHPEPGGHKMMTII